MSVVVWDGRTLAADRMLHIGGHRAKASWLGVAAESLR